MALRQGSSSRLIAAADRLAPMAPRHIALLAALSAIWGGSYLLIKFALEDLDAPVIVWARTAIAALVLVVALGSAAVRGALADLRRRPRLGRAARLLRDRAAVLADHARRAHGAVGPDRRADLARLAVRRAVRAVPRPVASRSTARQGVGMVIGLAGVALVVGVESVHSTGQLLGALAMIGAAASYALSGFVVKGRYGRLTSMQTSLVSVSHGVADDAAVRASPPRRAAAGRCARSLSVLALGAIGTALAFVIFYQLMRGRRRRARRWSPTWRRASRCSTARSLLDEPITAGARRRLVLILGGVALASRRARRSALQEAPHRGALVGVGT